MVYVVVPPKVDDDYPKNGDQASGFDIFEAETQLKEDFGFIVCYPELSSGHSKFYEILLSVPFLATRLSEYFVYRPVHSTVKHSAYYPC